MNLVAMKQEDLDTLSDERLGWYVWSLPFS